MNKMSYKFTKEQKHENDKKKLQVVQQKFDNVQNKQIKELQEIQEIFNNVQTDQNQVIEENENTLDDQLYAKEVLEKQKEGLEEDIDKLNNELKKNRSEQKKELKNHETKLNELKEKIKNWELLNNNRDLVMKILNDPIVEHVNTKKSSSIPKTRNTNENKDGLPDLDKIKTLKEFNAIFKMVSASHKVIEWDKKYISIEEYKEIMRNLIKDNSGSDYRCQKKPPLPTIPQMFIPYYMNPNNNYRSLLVYHSVGSGKTKLAQDTILQYIKQKKNNPNNPSFLEPMYLTTSTTMKEICKKEKSLEKYVIDYDTLNEVITGRSSINNNKISRKVENNRYYKLISKYIMFTSNGEQKRNVDGEFKFVEKSPIFSNFFILVDEAHILIDYPMIKDYLDISMKECDKMKTILMTATPVGKNPQNIFNMLNILRPESENIWKMWNDCINKTPDQNKPLITKEDEQKIENALRGLISYYNPKDTDVFASIYTTVDMVSNSVWSVATGDEEITVSIYTDHRDFKNLISKYCGDKSKIEEYLNIRVEKIKDKRYKEYYENRLTKIQTNQKLWKNICRRLSVSFINQGKIRKVSSILKELQKRFSIGVNNIKFANKLNYFLNSIYDECVLYTLNTGTRSNELKNPSDNVVDKSVYIVFLKFMDEQLRDLKGKHVVFTRLRMGPERYNMTGAMRLMHYLKLQKDKYHVVDNNTKFVNKYINKIKVFVFHKPYGPQTKQNEMKSIQQEMLSYFNDKKNSEGELVPLLIIDDGYMEGISISDAQFMHILEPPRNDSDLRQIKGRIRRQCLHVNRSKDKRKVAYIIYKPSFGNNGNNVKVFNDDKYLETISMNKLNSIRNLLEQSAFDVLLNDLSLHIEKDKFTNFEKQSKFTDRCKSDYVQYNHIILNSKNSKLIKNFIDKYVDLINSTNIHTVNEFKELSSNIYNENFKQHKLTYSTNTDKTYIKNVKKMKENLFSKELRDYVPTESTLFLYKENKSILIPILSNKYLTSNKLFKNFMKDETVDIKNYFKYFIFVKFHDGTKIDTVNILIPRDSKLYEKDITTHASDYNYKFTPEFVKLVINSICHKSFRSDGDNKIFLHNLSQLGVAILTTLRKKFNEWFKYT